MTILDVANFIVILLVNILFYLHTDVWFILAVIATMIVINLINLLRTSHRKRRATK